VRHFLRIDGDVQVGPSLGAVAFIRHGETLHLDISDPEQAKVADDVASASSGWVEVDDSGGAVTSRSRSATATATVTEPALSPDKPAPEEVVAVWPPTQVNAQDPGGQEPPPQV
jgi:hypothetical protein